MTQGVFKPFKWILGLLLSAALGVGTGASAHRTAQDLQQAQAQAAQPVLSADLSKRKPTKPHAQTKKDSDEDAADNAPVDPQKLPKIPELEPSKDNQRAASVAARVGLNYAYEKIQATPATSAALLNQYLDYLDPQHNIFLASDVARFQAQDSNLWDAVMSGNLSLPFEVYQLYRERYQSAMNYIIRLMEKQQVFNFSTQDKIAFNRSDDPRPTTLQARDRLWYLLVKNDFLNLKLAGDSDAKIYKKLLRRYVSQRNLFLQNESDKVAEGFINEALMSIDPHSNYYSPSSARAFKTELNNVLVGIGATLQQKYDYVRVVSLVAGGPAKKGNQLKPGDLIIGVGQGAKGTIQDTLGKPLDQVVDMIRGQKDTIVRLRVIPASTGGMDAKPVIISIKRGVVHLSSEVAKLTILKVGEKNTPVGLIRIPSFYQTYQDGSTRYSLPDDVAKAIKTLDEQHITQMVIDLRGNGGGSLSDTASLLGLFMGPNQVVVQTRQRNGHVTQVLTPADSEIIWHHPIVVLTDRLSASASEIFAGAIEDHQLGVVIGGVTWGKGTVQTVYDLDELIPGTELGSMKWTIAQFFRANGASTQAHGVTPNIVVPDGYDPDKNGEEHEYKNALPYATISAAKQGYNVFYNIPKILPALKKQWDQQVYGSLPWALYVQDQKLSVALGKQKYVVLNYQQRKQERADNEAARDRLRAVRKALDLMDKDVLAQEAAQLSLDLVKLAQPIQGTGQATQDIPVVQAATSGQ